MATTCDVYRITPEAGTVTFLGSIDDELASYDEEQEYAQDVAMQRAQAFSRAHPTELLIVTLHYESDDGEGSNAGIEAVYLAGQLLSWGAQAAPGLFADLSALATGRVA